MKKATKVASTAKKTTAPVKAATKKTAPANTAPANTAPKKTTKKEELEITNITASKDLFNAIAAQTGSTQKAAGEFYDGFKNAIKEVSLKSDQDELKIVLPEIGTFTVFVQPEHTSRNPRTGEEVIVPVRKRVRFKAFPKFTSFINGEE